MSPARQTQDASPLPLDYADARLPRRPARYVAFAVLSVLACLALLPAALMLANFARDVMQSTRGSFEQRRQAEREVRIAQAMETRPQNPGLAPSEAAAVEAMVRSQLARPGQPAADVMSGPQAAALERLLVTPGELLIEPTIPVGKSAAGTQAIDARLDQGRTLYLHATFQGIGAFVHGSCSMSIAADGTVTRLPPMDSPIYGASEAQWALVTLDRGPRGNEPLEFEGSVLAMVAAGAEIAMIVWLAAGARQLLRGESRGVRTHRLYAAGQVLVGLAAGVGVLLMTLDVPMGIGIYFGAIVAAIGCVYPLVIVVGLHRPSGTRGRIAARTDAPR